MIVSYSITFWGQNENFKKKPFQIPIWNYSARFFCPFRSFKTARSILTPKPKTKLLNSKTKHYWTSIHLFQNTTFDLLSKKCPKNDRKKFKAYRTYKIFSIQYINVISRVKTVHLFCIVQTLPDSSNFHLHFLYNFFL